MRSQIKRQEVRLFKEFKGSIDDASIQRHGESLDNILENEKRSLKKRSHILKNDDKTMHRIDSVS